MAASLRRGSSTARSSGCACANRIRLDRKILSAIISDIRSSFVIVYTGIINEMDKMIIGISGKKQHGKDTVAEMLHYTYGVQRIAFADKLKQTAMDLWGLSFDQLYDASKEIVDPRWGLSPRQIMQQFGTAVGRHVHDETWIRYTLNTIAQAQAGIPVILPNFENSKFQEVSFPKGKTITWAIPDVRFPNEAEAIRAAGGIIIKVIRPKQETIDNHDSERYVDDIVSDYVILNDGSLMDLAAKVSLIAQQVLQ
jgi:hypothetical protein